MEDVLLVLLAVIPAVSAWAFIIERLVELGKAQGIVKPDKAHLWSASLNAVAYIAMFVAAQTGYTPAVVAFAKQVEELWPVISAAVTLAVLAATSTGLSKVWHDLLKKLPTE